MNKQELLRYNHDKNTHLVATVQTVEMEGQVNDLFAYHAPDAEQLASMDAVREALAFAFKRLLRHVPSSPTRTRALNMLTDARMLANQAIIFKGEV